MFNRDCEQAENWMEARENSLKQQGGCKISVCLFLIKFKLVKIARLRNTDALRARLPCTAPVLLSVYRQVGAHLWHWGPIVSIKWAYGITMQCHLLTGNRFTSKETRWSVAWYEAEQPRSICTYRNERFMLCCNWSHHCIVIRAFCEQLLTVCERANSYTLRRCDNCL